MNQQIKLTPFGSLQRPIRLYGVIGVSHPGRVFYYMKHFIVTMLFVIMAIASTYAQTSMDTVTGMIQVPQKGTNTIQVRNVTFNQAINNLLDMGYHIRKSDKDFQTAETDQLGFTVIYIRIKDGDLYVTGQMAISGYTFKIDYNKHNKRWDDLMNYANSFKSNIYYASIR